MQQNQLFQKTRINLSLWYAGVMGILLSIGYGCMYYAIAHAHQVTLDREIRSVAGTLHDSLEFVLQKPSQLTPEIERFLPDLCEVGEDCLKNNKPPTWHAIGAVQEGHYDVRFLSLSGQLIAVAGMPSPSLSPQTHSGNWQTLTDTNGHRYRYIVIELHTANSQAWGTLQVGRSLQDFDRYMANVRLILLFGFPIILLFIGAASWGLAGLAMQPIYRSYRQTQQFTGDAAHELRTPLAAIRATIESTLQLPSLNEIDAKATLKTLDRQTQRLSVLVKDLLLLSRMEKPGWLHQQHQCCLNDLLADLEEELAAFALDSNIKLEVITSTQTPINTQGDEAQLYRMVYNLASNAIAYTPPGGTVTIRLEKAIPWAIVRIQDTGIGIAPEEQHRIFDRFYRISQDRARHTGGSGLGLAIAHTITQLHHGKIEVKSQLGKGSLFTIYLPLKLRQNSV
jgi:signal transduction histidine kinase